MHYSDGRNTCSGRTAISPIRRTKTPAPALVNCSFCGKSEKQVKKLIAGPDVYICDECIELCNEIIEEEMTEGASREMVQVPLSVPKATIPSRIQVGETLGLIVVGTEEEPETLSVLVLELNDANADDRITLQLRCAKTEASVIGGMVASGRPITMFRVLRETSTSETLSGQPIAPEAENQATKHVPPPADAARQGQ